jgi:uncharacterized protein YbbK (DUF523 family)
VIRILVSACLLGERVRYDGRDALCESDVLERWAREGRLVPFCPEVAGGFPVPRPPAEIVGGDGRSVLAGASPVRDVGGRDVTSFFLEGARGAVAAARSERVRLAVLKEGSPSCGTSVIYDGTFSGRRRSGPGVTAALLEQAGIRVFSENELAAAAAYAAALERQEKPEPA